MGEQLDLFERPKCDNCRGAYDDAHFAPYCSRACTEHIIGIMLEARIPDRFFIQRLRRRIEEWDKKSQAT